MNPTELVKAAQKGDDEAFYQLMLSCKDQLYRIAYSYLKSEQNALEAVQETTFRAYRQLRKLKSPENFKTWVIRILINYCIDEQRRQQREQQFIQAQSNSPGAISGIDSSTAAATERVELDLMVAQLEHPLRQIIMLKYFEDLTIRDIAQIMEKPEGTIKGWLNKALNQLRLQLDEGGKLHV